MVILPCAGGHFKEKKPQQGILVDVVFRWFGVELTKRNNCPRRNDWLIGRVTLFLQGLLTQSDRENDQNNPADGFQLCHEIYRLFRDISVSSFVSFSFFVHINRVRALQFQIDRFISTMFFSNIWQNDKNI